MHTRIVCLSAGLVGTTIASLFGGFNDAVITLFIFMAIDYVTGILTAAVFGKSKKTESGALSSKACLRGLIKKIGELIIVIIATRFDLLTGTTFVRDGAIIALIVYESISIVENLGLMGVPIPAVITKTIDVLKNDSEKGA